MKYIYQNTDWHEFRYVGDKLQNLLLEIKKAQGYLLGKMDTLGFDIKNSANLKVLTENIIKSSEIEGEILNKDEVRSSVARRLGIDIAGEVQVSRNIEGVVEMMLDASFDVLKFELIDDELTVKHVVVPKRELARDAHQRIV